MGPPVGSHPSTRPVTQDWIDRYARRQRERKPSEPIPADLEPEELLEPPTPHSVQQEALEGKKVMEVVDTGSR